MACKIAGALHAPLMFPGNVYNCGSPILAELTDHTSQRRTSRKGELRCRMEEAMRAEMGVPANTRRSERGSIPGIRFWLRLRRLSFNRRTSSPSRSTASHKRRQSRAGVRATAGGLVPAIARLETRGHGRIQAASTPGLP